jgi:branched-chain amino acid transport system ATP-binding protein
MTESLRIDRLSKKFGGLRVLNDLSLTVEAGEYVAVIGPNGAGKTTLLNVITGELPANTGRLYLFGKDITDMPTHQRIQAGLGRSFQITRLFYDLTVLDNLSLALQASHPSRYQMFREAARYREVITEAERLLKTIDLWHKKDELVASISYGEQRKMEITLALASNPKVLLMDEPTAGLASVEIHDFTNMIKALAADTTLIFSAHDMNVVFTLAKRVIVLYFGEIVAQGTPEQIQKNQKVREIYLGIKKDAPYAGVS